jgi:hypothetical protein
MSVHVLTNPIKVIKIEGNLNDKNSSIKPFAKINGNIFNGYWLIALKSFSYHIKKLSVKEVLKVHCNVVTGYEHGQSLGQAPKHISPPIAQLHLLCSPAGVQFKEFDTPTFFVINNVSDLLEIDFSYFPKETHLKDIPFEAVFHYYCQSN